MRHDAELMSQHQVHAVGRIRCGRSGHLSLAAAPHTATALRRRRRHAELQRNHRRDRGKIVAERIRAGGGGVPVGGDAFAVRGRGVGEDGTLVEEGQQLLVDERGRVLRGGGGRGGEREGWVLGRVVCACVRGELCVVCGWVGARLLLGGRGAGPCALESRVRFCRAGDTSSQPSRGVGG